MYNNYFMNDPFTRTYMMPAVEKNEYMNNNVFTNSNDGFLKGNMISGEFIPYKNMTYIKPNIMSEKDRQLYEIQELCFAAHDINLYLDTHPNDVNAINLFKKYNKESKEKELEYERKYGPINLSDDVGFDSNIWNWINNWPWNK